MGRGGNAPDGENSALVSGSAWCVDHAGDLSDVAALLGADVVEVVGAAVAYGATFTAAVASSALSGANLGLLLGNGYLQGQPAAVPECGGSFCGDVGSVPTVMMARQRLDDAVGKLKTDWANTFSPDHFNAYVAGLRLLPAEVLPSASLRSRPTASLASRARAASVTPRQAPSAKAAAATVEAAPTAEQSQRRAARGAAHRAERSGAGGIE